MNRTRKVSCHVTEEEYRMLKEYGDAVDRDMADLLRHALRSLLRQDKRRVPERHVKLLYPASTRVEQ